MSDRQWHRVKDAEDGTWAHRVYVSDDGWVADRDYSPGDRALNRPNVSWDLRRVDVSGYGSFIFDTLAECKAFADSPTGAMYVAWTQGAITLAEWQEHKKGATP